MSGSIGSIIGSAASGLAATQASIGVLSDNVANSSVAGYTSKTQEVTTFQVRRRLAGRAHRTGHPFGQRRRAGKRVRVQ